jgi:hypothetical protein
MTDMHECLCLSRSVVYVKFRLVITTKLLQPTPVHLLCDVRSSAGSRRPSGSSSRAAQPSRSRTRGSSSSFARRMLVRTGGSCQVHTCVSLMSHTIIRVLGGSFCSLVHMSDWTYVALPTAKLFRMPFVEQLDLMCKALEMLRPHILYRKWKKY